MQLLKAMLTECRSVLHFVQRPDVRIAADVLLHHTAGTGTGR